MVDMDDARSLPQLCDENRLMRPKNGFKIEIALHFPICQCAPMAGMLTPFATKEMNWNGKPDVAVARGLGRRSHVILGQA